MHEVRGILTLLGRYVMKKADLTWASNLFFYSGSILCGVSAFVQFSEQTLFYGYKPLSLFVVGIGLMVFHISIKLDLKK